MNSLDRSQTTARTPAAKINLWQMLTVLAWLSMYVSWIVPAWAIFADPAAHNLAWLFYFGSTLGSFSLAACLGWSKFKPSPERILLILLLLFELLVGLRWLVFVDAGLSLRGVFTRTFAAFKEGDLLVSCLATIAATTFLWRRGIVGWREWIGLLVVKRTLQQGIFVFLLVGSIRSIGQGPLPVTAFFLFLFSGLIAMGGARLSAQAHLRGSAGVPFQSVWLFGVGGAVLGLLTIAAAISALAGGPIAAALTALFGTALHGVLDVLLALLRPIVFLIIQAWNILLSRIGLDVARIADVPTLSLSAQAQEQVGLLGTQVEPPVWAGDLGRGLVWIGAGLVILIVLLVIFAILRRRGSTRQWRASLEEADRDQGSLLKALRDMIRPRGWGRGLTGPLQPARRLIAAARIRVIYLQLLRSLAKNELEREPSETPLEFLARLKGSLPGSAADLGTITEAYLRVRYGELPERRDEIDLVEGAWTRVRAALRHKDRGREAITAS